MYNTALPASLPGQPAPGPPAVRRSGPNWLLFAGLGFGGVIILFLVIAMLTAVLGIRQGPSAVPADFPVYPGATLDMAIGNEQWAASAVWTTNVQVNSVDAFYQEALSRPPWELIGPTPTVRGLRFRRTRGETRRGELRFVERNGQTKIELVLVSSSG